ncbi:putative CCR4-NOT transcription complex subunit 1 [Blattamonas nauphoetae]|uniref:CCR4-NOT transcription complex subunit 1 n=1 Tax=Blattamonas nauphoetae TaxID=2049346 RepID=A0ABQ9YG69_9EUKA|nr:putative CCR4-NOT transcription complex subunit 1 [Blattamonas nauphoetae]
MNSEHCIFLNYYHILGLLDPDTFGSYLALLFQSIDFSRPLSPDSLGLLLLSRALKKALRLPNFIHLISTFFETVLVKNVGDSIQDLSYHLFYFQLTGEETVLFHLALCYSSSERIREAASDYIYHLFEKDGGQILMFSQRTIHLIRDYYSSIINLEKRLFSQFNHGDLAKNATLSKESRQNYVSSLQTPLQWFGNQPNLQKVMQAIGNISQTLDEPTYSNVHISTQPYCFFPLQRSTITPSEQKWTENNGHLSSLVQAGLKQLNKGPIVVDIGPSFFMTVERAKEGLSILLGDKSETEADTVHIDIGNIVGCISTCIQEQVLQLFRLGTITEEPDSNSNIHPAVEAIINEWNVKNFAQALLSLFPTIQPDEIIRALDYPEYRCLHPSAFVFIQRFYSACISSSPYILSSSFNSIKTNKQFPFHVLFTCTTYPTDIQSSSSTLWKNRQAQLSLIQCAFQCSEDVFSFEDMSRIVYSSADETRYLFTSITDLTHYDSIKTFLHKADIRSQESGLHSPNSPAGLPSFNNTNTICTNIMKEPAPVPPQPNQSSASLPSTLYPSVPSTVSKSDFCRVLSAFRIVDVTLTLLALASPSTIPQNLNVDQHDGDHTEEITLGDVECENSLSRALVSDVISLLSLPSAMIPDFYILLLSSLLPLLPSFNQSLFFTVSALSIGSLLHSHPLPALLTHSLTSSVKFSSTLPSPFQLSSTVQPPLLVLSLNALHEMDGGWCSRIVDLIHSTKSLETFLSLLSVPITDQKMNAARQKFCHPYSFTLSLTFVLDLACLAHSRTILNLFGWLEHTITTLHQTNPTPSQTPRVLTKGEFVLQLGQYLTRKKSDGIPINSSLMVFFSPYFSFNYVNPAAFKPSDEQLDILKHFVSKYRDEIVLSPTAPPLDLLLDSPTFTSIVHSIHGPPTLFDATTLNPSLSIPLSFYSAIGNHQKTETLSPLCSGFSLQKHHSPTLKNVLAKIHKRTFPHRNRPHQIHSQLKAQTFHPIPQNPQHAITLSQTSQVGLKSESVSQVAISPTDFTSPTPASPPAHSQGFQPIHSPPSVPSTTHTPTPSPYLSTTSPSSGDQIPRNDRGSFSSLFVPNAANIHPFQHFLLNMFDEDVYRPSNDFQRNIASLIERLSRFDANTDSIEAIHQKLNTFINAESEIHKVGKESLIPFTCKYLLIFQVNGQEKHLEAFATLLRDSDNTLLLDRMLYEVRRTVIPLLTDTKSYFLLNSIQPEYTKLFRMMGTVLGALTIARNKPIKSNVVDVKQMLLISYQKGRLWAAIPFVCSLLHFCDKNTVFTPDQPWIMGILSLTDELCHLPLKGSITYELFIGKSFLKQQLEPDRLSDLLTVRRKESQLAIQCAPMLISPDSNADLEQSKLHSHHHRKSDQDKHSSFVSSLIAKNFGYTNPTINPSALNYRSNDPFKSRFEAQHSPRLHQARHHILHLTMALASNAFYFTFQKDHTFLPINPVPEADSFSIPFDKDRVKTFKLDQFDEQFVLTGFTYYRSLVTAIGFITARQTLDPIISESLKDLPFDMKDTIIATAYKSPLTLANQTNLSYKHRQTPSSSDVQTLLLTLKDLMLQYYTLSFLEEILRNAESTYIQNIHPFLESRGMTRRIAQMKDLFLPAFVIEPSLFSRPWLSVMPPSLQPDWTEKAVSVTLPRMYNSAAHITPMIAASLRTHMFPEARLPFFRKQCEPLRPEEYLSPNLIPELILRHPSSSLDPPHPQNGVLSTNLIQAHLLENLRVKYTDFFRNVFKQMEQLIIRSDAHNQRKFSMLCDYNIVKNEYASIMIHLKGKDQVAPPSVPHPQLDYLLSLDPKLTSNKHVLSTTLTTPYVTYSNKLFDEVDNLEVIHSLASESHATVIASMISDATKKCVAINVEQEKKWTEEFLKEHLQQKDTPVRSSHLFNELNAEMSKIRSNAIKQLSIYLVHRLISTYNPLMIIIPHYDSPTTPITSTNARTLLVLAVLHSSPQFTVLNVPHKPIDSSSSSFKPQPPYISRISPVQDDSRIEDYLRMLTVLHAFDPVTVIAAVTATAIEEGLGLASQYQPESKNGEVRQFRDHPVPTMLPPEVIAGRVSFKVSDMKENIISHSHALTLAQQNQWVGLHHLNQMNVIISLISSYFLSPVTYFQSISELLGRRWEQTFSMEKQNGKITATKPPPAPVLDAFLNSMMFAMEFAVLVSEAEHQNQARASKRHRSLSLVTCITPLFATLQEMREQWALIQSHAILISNLKQTKTRTTSSKNAFDFLNELFADLAGLLDGMVAYTRQLKPEIKTAAVEDRPISKAVDPPVSAIITPPPVPDDDSTGDAEDIVQVPMQSLAKNQTTQDQETIKSLFNEWYSSHSNNDDDQSTSEGTDMTDLRFLELLNENGALSLVSKVRTDDGTEYLSLYSTFSLLYQHTLDLFSIAPKLPRVEIVKDSIVSAFLNQQVALLADSKSTDEEEIGDRSSSTSDVNGSLSRHSSKTLATPLSPTSTHTDFSLSDAFCRLIFLVCDVIAEGHVLQRPEHAQTPLYPSSSPAYLSTLSLALHCIVEETIKISQVGDHARQANAIQHTHRILLVLMTKVLEVIPSYSQTFDYAKNDSVNGSEILQRVESLERWYVDLFCNVLGRLAPTRVPCFTYQFVSLLSSSHLLRRSCCLHNSIHPSEIPRGFDDQRVTPHNQNWFTYRSLLHSLLSIFSSIPSHKHQPSVSLLYSATLRLFMVIKTDFSDFLYFAAPSLIHLIATVPHKKLHSILQPFIPTFSHIEKIPSLPPQKHNLNQSQNSESSDLILHPLLSSPSIRH